MFIKKNDKEYPERLSLLHNMPESLYIAGELPEDKNPAFAIVGPGGK